jgi:hypothetical protein
MAMVWHSRRERALSSDGFKMDGISQPAYLRRRDAAAYVQSVYGIPCTPQWLAKLAVIGGGPLFRYSGRFPLYESATLDAWVKERIGPSVRTTAERTVTYAEARA